MITEIFALSIATAAICGSTNDTYFPDKITATSAKLQRIAAKAEDISKALIFDSCYRKLIDKISPAPGEYYLDGIIPLQTTAKIRESNIQDFEFTENALPKPPVATVHRAYWSKMVLYWFFELGNETTYFPSSSPESQDIADSYSMQQLRMQYYQTGEIPAGWAFSGPETAMGVYGEVEWFIGSYSIRNFKLQDGIATFEVLNTSGWESGTRLPVTWRESLQKQTYLPVPAKAFVDDAPRGKVLASKITERFPGLLKYSGAAKLLERMPSFGGNWYQIYAVEMEW